MLKFSNQAWQMPGKSLALDLPELVSVSLEKISLDGNIFELKHLSNFV